QRRRRREVRSVNCRGFGPDGFQQDENDVHSATTGLRHQPRLPGFRRDWNLSNECFIRASAPDVCCHITCDPVQRIAFQTKEIVCRLKWHNNRHAHRYARRRKHGFIGKSIEPRFRGKLRSNKEGEHPKKERRSNCNNRSRIYLAAYYRPQLRRVLHEMEQQLTRATYPHFEVVGQLQRDDRFENKRRQYQDREDDFPETAESEHPYERRSNPEHGARNDVQREYPAKVVQVVDSL